MSETIASMASKLVRSVKAEGHSEVKLDKSKLMSMRGAMNVLCCYEQLNVVTRYRKDSGVLHVFRVEHKL